MEMRTFVSRAAAGKRLLAALVPDVRVLDVQVEPEGFLLTVAPKARTAACPRCSTHSSRIHSSSIRHPADLPISDYVTRLLLHARRFRGVNSACPTSTFAERLPNLVLPAAQRTVRLNAALRDLALAFGGQAGARQRTRSAMPARGDTLLRRAHAASPPVVTTPRVLGIDDFSLRKGQVFGTILTDGERHRVIDLLPDRTAETAAAWLQKHPGVELITRDRSADYRRAISTGAPHAIQIADRFHLVKNAGAVRERVIQRNYQGLGLAAKAMDQEVAQAHTAAAEAAQPPLPAPSPPPTQEEQRLVQGSPARQHRRARDKAVTSLAAEGLGPTAIGQRVGLT